VVLAWYLLSPGHRPGVDAKLPMVDAENTVRRNDMQRQLLPSTNTIGAPELLAVWQDRAYTSPIWYTPGQP
jgi:hypothetical protein